MAPSLNALLTHHALLAKRRWSSTALARSGPVWSSRVKAHLLGVPAFYRTEALGLEDSNALIAGAILSRQAFLVSRFGSVELDSIMLWERFRRWGWTEKVQWAWRTGDWPRWNANSFVTLANPAGFFPADDPESVGRFAELYTAAAREIDLLGSWRNGESHYLPQKPAVTKLANLEPFFAENPWTLALRGKRVLVIHPFSATIQKQYLKRRQLFSNPEFLPDFDLMTLKIPYTFNGPGISELPSSNDWFGILRTILRQVEEHSFDVAIIGAGAYGLPIGEFVKRSGFTAIHLGGSTQLLFGIWGKRWAAYPDFKKMRNGSWVRPGRDEVPKAAQLIENAAYW